MIKEILIKIKDIIILLFGFIFVALIFGGIVFFIYNLKKKGKTLQIHPEFKVVDVYEENFTTLEESLNVANDILNKIQG
jgi:hypothetical protein